MSDYEYEDEITAAYEADPEGVTNRVIAEASAIAAAEIAKMRYENQEQELARIQQGQLESSSLVAFDTLAHRHGKVEWERLKPWVEKKITESPHLIPPDAMLSPSALTQSLEDVLALARQEADAEEKRNQGAKIKASNSNVPRITLG